LATTGKPLTAREQGQVRNFDYTRNCSREIQQSLDTIDSPQFNWLDLKDVFNDRRSVEEVFIDNCHFGDKGNIIIAERLFYELGRAALLRPPNIKE
jgi:hypothetical protein